MNPVNEAPESYLQDRPVLTVRQRRIIWLVVPLLLGSQPDPRVVIVQISEADRRRLTQGDERFDLRTHLDEAIARLADAGAVAIGLDFWLQGHGDAQIDRQLALVLAETNVVLGVAIANDVYVRAPRVLLEAEPDEGSLAVQPDPDGVLRRLPVLPNLDLLDDEAGSAIRIPHFPFVLAYLLLAEEAAQGGRDLPDVDLPATGEGRLGNRVVRYGQLINYAAGPGSGFTTFDFAEVVRGQCDLTPVDGAAALIGNTRSLEDQFTIPLVDKLIPGVFYHANVIDMILQDRPLAEWPAHRDSAALLVGLIGCVAGWYFLNLRQWWARRRGGLLLAVYFVAGAVVFIGGWCFVCQLTFRNRTVVPMVPPIAGIAGVILFASVAQLAVTITNARRLSQRNRQIELLFGRSVSSQVLAAIKADPSRVARTELREVSVLFCDVRGFTATSTQMSPEAVADMLNEYFEAITSAVFEYHGFVDKFVGDELMAVFGAPLEQSDHTIRAAKVAIAIKRQLRALNERRAARGRKPLDCGIGIHCGPVAAGHIGTARRANYTVVGDTVNLAARIEELTTGGEILVSQAVVNRLSDALPARPWRSVQLRGRAGRHQLYQLAAS